MKQQTMFVLFIALNGARVALAQTDEDRQACVNDALQLCQEAIPDRERVFGCLVSHKDLLSPACHAVMARSQAIDQPPLKKRAPRAKRAGGEGTSAKHASKAVSGTPAKHASKAVSGTSAKHASKAVSGTSAKHASKAVSGASAKHGSKAVSGTSAKHASKPVSGTAAKHASKAASRPNRRPFNLLPQ
jgi:hypothetical protein